MSKTPEKIALWEDLVLRGIAIYKLLHAGFFIAAGFGLLRLRHHNVVEILNSYVIIPYHLNPEDEIVDWVLDLAQNLTSHKLAFLGYAAFFYAALFAAEGIGLYLRKRWAEYLVVIVGASLLPFELYELYLRLAWWKLGVIVGNLAIVFYLIHRLLLDSRRSREIDGAESPSPTLPKESRPVASEVP
jgi:uncharacterized membrane protein (DUF2068 family)